MKSSALVVSVQRHWVALCVALAVWALLAVSGAFALRFLVDPRSAPAAPVSPLEAAALVYPAVDQAEPAFAAALRLAADRNRRVLVVFGANWCADCKALSRNLRRPENAALIDAHYEVVKINVGEKGISDNQALAQRLGVPLAKGVPAVAVMSPNGAVVHAQRNGEFEPMRQLDPKTVTDFLNRWKN